ncbi:MAG: hypothetical protein ACRDTA_14775 [Pseudonocardiaceae bacterium]
MTTRSVDDVAAELYAVEPSAFVAARTEAARTAREVGDRELAAAIEQLRRPALAAWALNLLARDDVAGLARLVALGEELREAQQQLRGETLQRLSRERHEVLATLTRRARKLAADAGHPIGAEAAHQVEQTLGAALADPGAAQEVRAGRLVTPLSYAGFGPAVGSMPAVARSERAQPAHRGKPRDEELAQRPRTQRERWERELAEACREVAPLLRHAQQATEALERTEDAVTDARLKLAEATERRDAAARDARVAERTRRDAERRVRRLTERLNEAADTSSGS